jgi:threonine dehydrogenase-like Zn-dependent dehydrogenase
LCNEQKDKVKKGMIIQFVEPKASHTLENQEIGSSGKNIGEIVNKAIYEKVSQMHLDHTTRRKVENLLFNDKVKFSLCLETKIYSKIFPFVNIFAPSFDPKP